MQTDRTLQFWDTYHKENESKEWIFQPSTELLGVLLAKLTFSEKKTIQMLEIGCGTSTMARNLWQLLVQAGNPVRMCATDVSPVCIEVSKNRDAEIISNNNENTALEYRVLNVLEDKPEPPAGLDVILDKGCVDTFLFRSKNRGENHEYTNILQEVLNNIWSWMAADGVFLVISPRSKLKAVRDFSGFSSVERHLLTRESSKGELVGDKNDSGTPAYVYVCRKNVDYKIGETPTYTVNFRDLPEDDARCPNCGLTFQELRKGEAVERRGVVFWTRQWKGHRIHCKAPHKPK
jgi:hypothetical protein